MTPGWPAALSRRFVPLAVLGSGAFGTVFQARDARSGAVVAVKVLRPERRDALRAFKREFRALADLAHEHLVGLHELSCEGDQWFLVMEWVEGVDLTEVRDPELARRALAQVALGLAFLHQEGRLHRDLKPSNVRVTPAGRAVVLDFGFALEGPEREDEGLVGSAAYLSPEQAAGAPASPASDAYALGVMLHEVLTGGRPFEGTAREVLSLKRRLAPPPLEPLDPAQAPLMALCRKLLSREPEARATVAEVVAGLDASLVPQLGRRVAAPLVGREAALAELLAAFAASRRGPVVVWLRGHAGLGKSTLLRTALARLEAADAVVLAARCFEQETLPCKAVDGLVDQLARWLLGRGEALPASLRARGALLARVFPALAQVPDFDDVAVPDAPASTRLREAAVALRELVDFVAAAAPLVLAVDDLHWADADSLPFLAELLGSTAPLLFVGAYRDDAAAQLEPLRALRLPTGGAEQRDVPLSPLSTSEARALAGALAAAPEVVERVVHEAQGNPLLLQQLAEFSGAGAAPGGPTGLAAAVQHRVARLAPAAQRLLEAACLFGGPLPQALWAEVGAAGGEASALPSALSQLRAARLLKSGLGTTLEPYHDQIRVVVQAGLPASARAASHGRIADALARAPVPDPDQLAHHLAGAGRLEPAAAQALVAAERALRNLAFHHAALQYEKALTWAPGLLDARRVRVAQAEALALAGRGGEAAQAFLQACEGAGPGERLELQRRAGAQLLRNGHIERGFELTRIALEALGLRLARTPRGAVASLAWTRARLQLRRRGLAFVERTEAEVGPAELARIDALTATAIGLAAVDSLRAQDVMSQALLRALEAGEPSRVAVCLGYETAFLGNAGGRAEARTRRLIAAADALSRRLGTPYVRGCALGGAGIAFFHLGHLAASRQHCEAAAELFEAHCPGAVKEFFTNQLFAFAALAQGGALGELGRRVPAALRQAEERGDRYAAANLRTGLINLVWLAADEPRAARAEADAALPGLETRGYSIQHFFDLLCRFHLALYEGDGPGLREVLRVGLPALDASLLGRVEWIAVARAWMVGRAALALGGRGAGATARRAAAALERRERPWVDALALTLRAGVAELEGDAQRALSLYRAAGEGFAAAELGLHAASVRLAEARLLGGDEGLALRRRAAAQAQGLGVRAPERMARLHVGGALDG